MTDVAVPTIAQEAPIPLQLPVDLRSYDRDVIYQTAYAFSDRATLRLEPGSDHEIIVHLTGKEATTNLKALADEFANALVDFALRKQIAITTGAIRETLFQAALGGLIRQPERPSATDVTP